MAKASTKSIMIIVIASVRLNQGDMLCILLYKTETGRFTTRKVKLFRGER